MASLTNLIVLPLLLLATFSPTPSLCYVSPSAAGVHEGATQTSAYRTYIVLVKPPPSGTNEEGHRRWYETFLPSSHIGESGEPRLLHSYIEVFSGFAARLTEAELDAVTKKPGFVRAFPDRTLQLMTTHTPEFLGLRNGTGFWSDAGYGKGVVIGLLDTGIYATHPSFDDHGVQSPPTRWKSSCKAVRCNNKLIGANSFTGDNDSYDYVGHGTHTSSTAAGNFVTDASDHGVGTGTASGIAPGAHIAMYKVCTAEGCEESAVVAGLDAAIKDGVDVLSLSLSSLTGVSFNKDPIAIGAFSAISKGIIVVCAAGNKGPAPQSVSNSAPWLLTVAAGSVDRRFDAGVHLGNGKRMDGEAFTPAIKPTSKPYPLLYSEEHRFCQNASYGSVAGKIIVCQSTTPMARYSDISKLMGHGAAGVVLFNDKATGYTIILQDFDEARVVQVTFADGIALATYTKTSLNNAVATFTYNNTVLGVRPNPVVASFSSRGPSSVAPGVLKPDILAPGLNILAAWPSPPFKIISGTSMATPHVSGAAALIKSLHPDWSPAAIKSAILTTSDTTDNISGSILNERHDKASAYDRGAGHVNPARAADPGLVYDLGVTDYAGYICWLLGDEGLVTIVRNSSLTCAKLPKVKDVQLNYPTLTVPLASTPFTVTRTVTNVGPADSTYAAKVDSPSSMKVHVSPETLVFSKAGGKKTFSVTVSCQGVGASEIFVEGSLSWVSKKNVVRSPIVAIRGAGGPAPAPSP
nr:subtilisin-like protease 4 [Aegilops tauschii subsp. strangulata]